MPFPRSSGSRACDGARLHSRLEPLVLTAVTTAVIVHALPSGLAAADSGTAKPGTGAFVASPTNEAHGRRPDVLAIDIFLLAA